MEVGAEKVKPYAGDCREKGEQVREMFDNIATAYDFMNRAMTLGIDKLWRKKAVRLIQKALKGISSPAFLDVATGTGDLALLLARIFPQSKVTGIDLSKGMVDIGNAKAQRSGVADRVVLGVADCLALPFAENSFDCVTVAYGVRNFEHLDQGYREMFRVLRPGGFLCVVELSTPTSKLALPFYKFYTKRVIPLAGRMVSKDVSAYAYLPQSIAAVAQREEMDSLISQAGFSNAQHKCLTFGVCTIYTASKP